MGRFTIAVLIGCVALAARAHAQPPNERTIASDGTEVFCQILFHEGLKPIPSLDALAHDQKDTLLIVLGKPDRWNEMSPAQFVAKGGNLLVATDYPFVSGLNINVRGTRIEQPAPFAYGGKPQCPWVPSAWGDDHPLFAGLHKRIATNCPSSLSLGNGNRDVRPVLDFMRAENGGFSRLTYMAGSSKDAAPQGRILFIAGHGMFMNGMMLQTDNDNFEFAVNAIRWLRAGPNGATRSRGLLMVDGEIVADFNMDLATRTALPLPPQMPIPPVTALNRLIRGMEEERIFHKILRGLLGESFERVIGVLIAIATFGLLIYGAKKFMEGRFHHETGVPRMVGAAPPLGPGLRRGQQRQLALFDLPDAAEECKQLVHAWMRAEFGVGAQQWTADTPVEFRLAGAWWPRWRLQRRANEVLPLARNSAMAPVSRGQFSRLIESLTELTEARAAGRLILLVDGKSVRQGSG
jgi:hypothetical protein